MRAITPATNASVSMAATSGACAPRLPPWLSMRPVASDRNCAMPSSVIACEIFVTLPAPKAAELTIRSSFCASAKSRSTRSEMALAEASSAWAESWLMR